MAKQKPTLLFLHGLRGNGLGLQALAQPFEPDYEVHVPTLPPAGDLTLEAYDTDHFATFVADYILEHHLDRPILIGHSLGSIIAAATAEKYPELVGDKLVLLAPISKKVSPLFRPLSHLAGYLPNRVASVVTTCYLFVPHDRQRFRSALDLTIKCGADFSSRRAVSQAAVFSARHAVSDFHFPQQTLFLAGAHDRLNSAAITRATAKQYGAEAQFIKNTGHLLNYEDPAATAAAIRAFLKK